MDQPIDTSETTSLETGTGTGSDTNIEAEASKMGWVPQERFRGDPERWVDAKTFVDKGREVLPIVKAELRKTREELADIKKAAAEWQRMSEADTERKVNEWKAKFDEAIRDKSAALTQGDGDKFVEAEARQKELEASRPQPKTEEQPKVDPAFAEWRSENEWYGTDRKKTLKANLLGADLSADQPDGTPGLRGRALYDAVVERLAEEERASTGTTRQSAQRGGRPAASTKGAKTYENLLPEYREACDRFVKSMGIKKEAYLDKCGPEAFRS